MQSMISTPDVWVGIDWGDTSHSTCIINADGKILSSFDVPHNSDKIDEMIRTIKSCGNVLGVCVETNHGLLVLKLLEANLVVYVVNPKLSDQWRKACSVSESKSDGQDSFILAEGLRLYNSRLHPLQPDDENTRELQGFCHLEVKLIQERTTEVERLLAALKEYHPDILAWFSSWTCQSAWDFVQAFPTPKDLRKASTKKLMGFLKTHRMRLTAEWQQRMNERTSLPSWPEDPAAIHVQTHTALAAVSKLKVIEKSIKEVRKHIDELFEKHPDADVFDSLPGAGKKLRARLLAAFGSNRERFKSAEDVQKIVGVVPVTRKSGNSCKISLRHACRKEDRHTFYLHAFNSISRCQWARAFYDKCRSAGDSHSLSLRKLGSKWAKIIFAMWSTKQRYNDRKYMESLVKQGSPLVESLNF